ncbi:MAG: MFS transporter [Acidobacteria bacterium]|nr:MFS transporter [Acidobacteriota bacterium]
MPQTPPEPAQAPSPEAAAPLSFGAVLAIPPFRRLWIGQVISVFGDFLAIFAVFAIATFRFKASASEITFVLVAFMAPMAVISPVAGVLVDRWNLKRTMIASDLIRALLVLALAWTTSLQQIYAIFAVLSAVSSFFIPAQSVAVRGVVPQNGLMAANGLMSQAFQVTMIVSPALAGGLVAFTGPEFCYYIDTVSFLASAWLIAGVATAPRDPGAQRQLGGLMDEMSTGLRFIFTHSAVSFVMIAMTVGMFSIRCFGALLAVWVRDVLRSGETAFGILNSLIGVGMILGTQAIHRIGRNRTRSGLVVMGLSFSGVLMAVPAIHPSTWTTVIGLLGLGFGVAFIFIPAQTLLQQVTPVAMLGRVSSAMMSSLAFIQVSALLLSGQTAATVGIRNLYLGSGALLVVISAIGYRKLAAQEVAEHAAVGAVKAG